jgi:cytochrome c-type biogenesis protein CcmI
VTIALAILLTVAVVAVIFHPLVTGRAAPLEASTEDLTDAQHRKRMALLALRDVEYDFHAGKLDEADYRNLRAQASTEALAALDEEERGAPASASATGRPDVEAEIAALRASIREGAVCPHCAHPNPRGSRFCGECGAAIATSPRADAPPPATAPTPVNGGDGA